MGANVAVAGFGYSGRNVVRNIHALGALRVICDADAARRDEARAAYPAVPFTTDFSALLADPAIEAVALATPAATHFALARQALEAGKDVLVEKPLALTAAEGRQLVDLSNSLGRILMVGHVLRYHPAVLRLRELIQAGALGRLQYLYSNRLNIGKIRSEENILWSFAPHDISVMLELLGEEPCAVVCQGGNYLHPAVPDVTMSQFLFPSGVRAHIFVSWLHPFEEQRLVVVGSEKMAVFDDTAEQKLVVYPHRVEWKNRVPTAVKMEGEPVEIEPVEPLREECRHFLDCVATRQPPRTDGEEGLRVLKVLEACQRSLENAECGMRSAECGAEHPRDSGSIPHSAFRIPHYFAHPTAVVDEPCEIGAGTKIWHFGHIMKGAKIGERCVFGQNCNVAEGVVIGDNVKVQNNVSIYTGTTIEDDVFLGPSCVLTNVSNPRSQVNRHALYEKTLLRRGATIGANATIVCGIEIGRYAFVAAGAVVTKSLPDYALAMGVPARQAGWMSRHGHKLGNPDGEGIMTCPESGYRYKEVAPGVLRCLDLDEEAPLPAKS